jgi:RNA polymerase sigma-70 factor (ECF subfamily)
MMTDPANRMNFDQWLAEVRPGLVRMAHSILRNRDDAEDVVQETLVSVWEMHARGRIARLQPYAKRAVWINSIKLRSRGKQRQTLAFDELRNKGIPEPYSNPVPEPELSALELERAIMDLPPEQQAVIRLRFYGGLSFREIGRSLSISLNTAASRSRYAIRGLRKAFDANRKKEKSHGQRKR